MSSESKMDAVLLELGFDDFCKGTAQLRTAIRVYVPDMSMTKELYPYVAMQHNTTPSRAERAMRHVIEKAWLRGNVEAQRKYFGWSVDPEKGRPGVGEFIARLSRVCYFED